MPLIYVQLPPKNPVEIIRGRLKVEEHFEDVTKMTSFRAGLLRSLLEEIEKTQKAEVK